VVTDEKSLRVCGKCCLTCSGKSEEDGCVLAIHICVRGAMHGSDALKRQIIVHHGEETFLHFSAVPCVHDHLLAACDIEHYRCLRVQPQFLIILYLCLGSVVYNEIRLEVLKFFRCRLYKHICNEV